jgi:L-alanine-DL-glutamate epimerase-like enolase superfamily enzyme
VIRRLEARIARLEVRRGPAPERDRIEVHSADGLAGHGEGIWGEAALGRSPELLLGRSPFEMEAIFDDIHAETGETAGGLDIALWNLAAGCAGLSAQALFGKQYRRDVHVRAFPLEEFLVEPLPESDLEGYRRLRESSVVPVAVGLTFPFAALAGEFVANELADLVMPDIARCGLTGLRRLSYYCWVFRVRLAVACSGSPIALAAARCAASCFPPVTNALAAPAPFIALLQRGESQAGYGEPEVILGS